MGLLLMLEVLPVTECELSPLLPLNPVEMGKCFCSALGLNLAVSLVFPYH